MPNECKPRPLSVALSPGRRPTASRSGSTTPSNDNRRAASHSPACGRTSAGPKSRGCAPPYRVKASQVAVRQQSTTARLPSKSSYAAQCSAVAPLTVVPKSCATQFVSSRNVTPKRPVVLRVSTSSQSTTSPAIGTPTFGKDGVAFGQIVRLDLSEPDETQIGCSLSAEDASDGCLGNQSGRGESLDTSARFECVSAECHNKGTFLGDTNSTCSGSSTPRVDSHRSQSDEIAAAIAAARFAASGSMDLTSIANGGKRRESELYVDCAKLRWRMWMQELSREEGQECTSAEDLAPHAANFAAHVLWEHDRAILEAERCNALFRDAKLQTERAEEKLARFQKASVSANALQQESEEVTERFEYQETPEQWCASELSSALARSDNLGIKVQECECSEDLLNLSLVDKTNHLHRSQEAHAALSTRVESVEAETSAESVVVRALRHELSESKKVMVEDRTAGLAQELQRMIGMYEKQEADLQEMLARSAELSSSQCSAQSNHSKDVNEVSLQTEPDLVSNARAYELTREVDSLQDLVHKLAEEMGRLHSSHAELAVEKDAILKERSSLREKLEEAEVLNSYLEEEVLRLRPPREQDVAMRGNDVLPHYPAPLRNGRTTVSQASGQARSQLLAEALARENRRLRTTTRSVSGQSALYKSP